MNRLHPLALDVSGVNYLKPDDTFTLDMLDNDKAVVQEVENRQIIIKQIDKENIKNQMTALVDWDRQQREISEGNIELWIKERQGLSKEQVIQNILEDFYEWDNGGEDIRLLEFKLLSLQEQIKGELK